MCQTGESSVPGLRSQARPSPAQTAFAGRTATRTVGWISMMFRNILAESKMSLTIASRADALSWMIRRGAATEACATGSHNSASAMPKMPTSGVRIS